MANNQVPLAFCAGLVPIKNHYHNKESIVMAGKVISQKIIDKHKALAETFIISLRHSQNIEATVQQNKEVFNQSQQDVKLENMAQHYEADTVIFEQGDTSNELYVLLEGEINVLINDNVVATIKESGAYFGEMALLRHEPRSATIRTATDTKFYVISGAAFPSIIKANPDVSSKISQLLAERLAGANEALQISQEKVNGLTQEFEALRLNQAKPEELTKLKNESEEKDELITRYKGAALTLFKKSAGEYNSLYALIQELANNGANEQSSDMLKGLLSYMNANSNMIKKGKKTPVKTDKLNDFLKSLLNV